MLYQATSELGVEVICQAGLDASKAWLKRARHALARPGGAIRRPPAAARRRLAPTDSQATWARNSHGMLLGVPVARMGTGY